MKIKLSETKYNSKFICLINFCLLILGASVGCRFANKTFKEVASNSFHGLVATTLLVLLGLIAAYIATFFVDTDFSVCNIKPSPPRATTTSAASIPKSL